MSNKNTIIIVILAIVIIGLVGYIFISNQRGEDFRQPPFRNMQNFSLTDEIKNSTIEYFDSSPSLEDARAYCVENRMNCFYYCRELNSEHEICDEMMTPNGQGFGGQR